jgi:type IV pilus assembly protein PilA
MLQRLHRRAQGQEGFTLIELLVVILIIGVLAAIAIPVFLNQKDKASDAGAKSSARTAQTAQETFFTDQAAYSSSFSDLTAIEPTLNSAKSPTAVSPAAATYGSTVGAGTPTTTNSFVVKVESDSGVSYAITRRTDGTVDRTCNVPTGASSPGGCKLPSGVTSGDGDW